MWGQVINVAFHSLFWDLKQCFVWVLFCRLLFSSGCLNASGLSLCVYACVHVSVCGHVCFLKIHALPATLSEKYKPWLLSVYRSTSCWFYFLFFLSCSSSSLYCDPRRQGVQTECPESGLIFSAEFCSVLGIVWHGLVSGLDRWHWLWLWKEDPIQAGISICMLYIWRLQKSIFQTLVQIFSLYLKSNLRAI